MVSVLIGIVSITIGSEGTFFARLVREVCFVFLRAAITEGLYRKHLKRGKLQIGLIHYPRMQTAQDATLILKKKLTDSVMHFVFEVPEWSGHRAGQYCALRHITKEGFVVERDYSLAAIAKKHILEFSVQIIETGELSPHLWNLSIGDTIQIHGPRGKDFVWDETKADKPLIFIAGGSGIVPFRSMLQAWHLQKNRKECVLFGSFKKQSDILYFDELEEMKKSEPLFKGFLTLTQEKHPARQDRADYFTGRITKELLKQTLQPFWDDANLYISGSSVFVEDLYNCAKEVVPQSTRIYVERFG